MGTAMKMQKNGTGNTQLDLLTSINLDDFCKAFGASPHGGTTWLLRRLLRPAARRFARQIINFDQEVLEVGLAAASQQFLETYIQGMQVTGVENLPIDSPLLVLSNHPGLTDTLALFASIPRPDLRVVALDRPFLRAMPETNRRLFFVSDQTDGRINVIRSVGRHLRAGGAVLTFPAGEIEPDPASMPGSIAGLENWSRSLAFFVRISPETRIIPVIVSGVYAPQALRHPLVNLRRSSKDREILAANLQILVKSISVRIWPVNLHVDFGPPILSEDLLKLGDASQITQAVTNYVQGLLEVVHPAEAQHMIDDSQPAR